MATTNLGKVSLTPRGAYDPAVQYEALDLIQHGGSSFVVLRSVQGVEPVDGEDYMLLTEKGDPATVCGKGADSSGNIALTAGDVGARPNTWTPNVLEIAPVEAPIPRWGEFLDAAGDTYYGRSSALDSMIVGSINVANEDLLLRDASGGKFVSANDFMLTVLDVLSVLEGINRGVDYESATFHATWYEFQYVLLHYDEVNTSCVMPTDAELRANAETEFPWRMLRPATEQYVDLKTEEVKSETLPAGQDLDLQGQYALLNPTVIHCEYTPLILSTKSDAIILQTSLGGVALAGPYLGGIADPSNDDHAANKKYVDGRLLAMAQSGGYTGTATDLCKDLASLQGLADALAAL